MDVHGSGKHQAQRNGAGGKKGLELVADKVYDFYSEMSKIGRADKVASVRRSLGGDANAGQETRTRFLPKSWKKFNVGDSPPSA